MKKLTLPIDPLDVAEFLGPLSAYWADAVPRNRILRAALLRGLRQLAESPDQLPADIRALRVHRQETA